MKNFTIILLALLITCATVNGQNDSILVDTLFRSYLVHLPTQYSANKTYPLVINMHGAGSNGAQQELYSFFNPVANAEEFIIVYPNGIYNIWNAGFAINSDSLYDDVGFISALIDTMAEDYPIDLNRVYACGMSMGGFMSYRLACELENRIAAIASVTGSMTDALISTCNPTRNVPIMQIHGTADSTVLYGGEPGLSSIPDVINFWVQQQNCVEAPFLENLPDNVNDGSNVIRYTYEPCDLSSEVVLYEVVNGGHTWPGAFFTIVDAGITNRDIEAQEEIWDFFSRHRLDNPPTNLDRVKTKAKSYEMYPNPAKDQLTVVSKNETGSVIHLIDVLGNILMNGNVTPNLQTLQFSLENLKPGIYSLVMYSQGEVASQKLIITK